MCDFEIVITLPDTETNWLNFNVPCEDLDSDMLLQPSHEADYDSETQACVDMQADDGPKKFFDHYVRRRKKKKGLKCRVEGPAPGGVGEGPRTTPDKTAMPAAPPALLANADFLTVPQRGAVPKGVLKDAAARRIACGVMPPRHADPEVIGAPAALASSAAAVSAAPVPAVATTPAVPAAATAASAATVPATKPKVWGSAGATAATAIANGGAAGAGPPPPSFSEVLRRAAAKGDNKSASFHDKSKVVVGDDTVAAGFAPQMTVGAPGEGGAAAETVE
jgi:hypothetical protein